MLKKVVAGLLVFTSVSLFGMSLSELNAASKAELMEIHGIGEAKANAILKERKNGKFKSFEDFTRVKGVGQALAKKVQNDVKSAPKKKATGTKPTAKKQDKKSTKPAPKPKETKRTTTKESK